MDQHKKEMMCFLAALLMPAANGKVSNALNLAEGLVEEADKRWPDRDAEDDRAWREGERNRQNAGSAPAAQTPANPEGGQQ